MTKSLTYVEVDLPPFISTIVNLPFDDAINSPQTIIDTNTEQLENVWTFSGDAILDPTGPPIPAFGSNQLKFNGAGAINTADRPEFAFSDGDWSIEFYFWNNLAVGTAQDICGQRNAPTGGNSTRAWNIFISSTGHVTAEVFVGASSISVVGTTVFGISTSYHHISLNRHGIDLLLFIDGVLEDSTTIVGEVNDATGTIGIGQDGDNSSASYKGWIDEFSISKFARRTEKFTPTQSLYPSASPALYQSQTFRFAIDAAYLPINIDAIPSIKQVTIEPAIISLGQDLGQRATVTVTFRDHRHSFFSGDFNTGTFWGKFRACYGLKLRGFPLRVIIGSLGQALADMETRHFIIENTDGPSSAGEYRIIAKDILKFADSDRSQAPVPSNGFLVANITNVATSATLSPSGIGNLEYPASGLVAIGGSEICSFTRSGDVLTLTRAQKNTVGVAHSAQDRVQLVLQYTAQDAATIINDLLVTYAGVPQSYITLDSWLLEVGTYLNTVYTATIAEPTSVSKLVSELIEQVGLVVWWDAVNQQVRLQVLRPIASTADVFDGDNYMGGTLKVEEQPDKRLTQVYTYFSKFNPLVQEDQLNNYLSTSYVIDSAAEAAYGTSVIKKIFSRWIPAGGRAVADTLGSVLLARFSDPPRRISFDVLRGSSSMPILGGGYQIGGWPFQDIAGDPITIPAQITSLNPRADFFEIETEEISANTFTTGVSSPNEHDIIIDAHIFNVNLRTMHDSIYGVPSSGVAVYCTINSGIIVGSTSTGNPAFTVGTWPAGVTIFLIVLGRIEGKGGQGGVGVDNVFGPQGSSTGKAGGVALYTRQAITVSSNTGQIWGGGGGGGGGGSSGNSSNTPVTGGSGGGGGAGKNPGDGGGPGSGINLGVSGHVGTTEAGGAGGGIPPGIGFGGPGGTGGGPGLAGSTGSNGTAPIHTSGGAGGAAGKSIDGISFVSFSGSSPQGDIRGPQVN